MLRTQINRIKNLFMYAFGILLLLPIGCSKDIQNNEEEVGIEEIELRKKIDCKEWALDMAWEETGGEIGEALDEAYDWYLANCDEDMIILDPVILEP